MTELTPPNRTDHVAPAAVPAMTAPLPTVTAAVAPASRAPLFWLLGLILLSVLLLLSVAIWRLHDQSRISERNEAVLQETVAELRRDLSESMRNQTLALSTMQEKIALLQGSHDDLRALVAGGADSFADAQRRHAAEYYIHQAAQRLSLQQDLRGAIAALDGAAQELLSSKLPANQALRQRVIADRDKLAAAAPIDVLATARELADLQQRVSALQALGPALENGRYLIQTDGHETGWLGDLKSTWQQFSGDWFLVRKHDAAVVSPPDAAEGRRIKLALSLALSEARLAAFQHESSSYQEALARALRLLDQYYSNADGSDALRTGLLKLQQQTVAIDVELKLSALTEGAQP